MVCSIVQFFPHRVNSISTTTNSGHFYPTNFLILMKAMFIVWFCSPKTLYLYYHFKKLSILSIYLNKIMTFIILVRFSLFVFHRFPLNWVKKLNFPWNALILYLMLLLKGCSVMFPANRSNSWKVFAYLCVHIWKYLDLKVCKINVKVVLDADEGCACNQKCLLQSAGTWMLALLPPDSHVESESPGHYEKMGLRQWLGRSWGSAL